MLSGRPNAFITDWTTQELRAWWAEIRMRTRNAKVRKIYEGTIVPTRGQVLTEFKRRGLPLRVRKKRTSIALNVRAGVNG